MVLQVQHDVAAEAPLVHRPPGEPAVAVGARQAAGPGAAAAAAVAPPLLGRPTRVPGLPRQLLPGDGAAARRLDDLLGLRRLVPRALRGRQPLGPRARANGPLRAVRILLVAWRSLPRIASQQPINFVIFQLFSSSSLHPYTCPARHRSRWRIVCLDVAGLPVGAVTCALPAGREGPRRAPYWCDIYSSAK